jgi:hypothetical protein
MAFDAEGRSVVSTTSSYTSARVRLLTCGCIFLTLYHPLVQPPRRVGYAAPSNTSRPRHNMSWNARLTLGTVHTLTLSSKLSYVFLMLSYRKQWQ